MSRCIRGVRIFESTVSFGGQTLGLCVNGLRTAQLRRQPISAWCVGRVDAQLHGIVIPLNIVCTALLPYQSGNSEVIQRDAEAQLCEVRSDPIDLQACQQGHIHVCSGATRGIASPTISVKAGLPRCSSRCPHFECCLPWLPVSMQRHEAHDNFRCAHR